MTERLKQLERVGCGAMAEVFRGALVGERGTSRTVAIKRLRVEHRRDPAAVELFVNEARIAVQLSHPNVVHALELCRFDDGYVLVCEWLDCASLGEIVERGVRLSPAMVCHVAEAVGEALHYLHHLEGPDGKHLGLVHRDVTPANIFVTQRGEIKLGDFGVAWCQDGVDLFGARVGTPEFAAPEQKEGGPLDNRADVYGLAAALRSVADPLPEPMVQVLDRGTATNPDARYASARELAAALVAAGGDAVAREAPDPAQWLADCGGIRAAASPPQLDGAVQSILGNAWTQPESVVPDAPVRPRGGSARSKLGLAILGGLAAVYLVVFGSIYLNGEAAAPPVETPPTVRPTMPKLDPPTPAPEAKVEAPSPEADTSGPAPVPSRSPVVTAPAKGVIFLNSVPWATVSIDGRSLGNTPLRDLSIRAGRHQVQLVNPPQGLSRSVAIEVDEDRTQIFLVDLRQGTVDKRYRPRPRGKRSHGP